MSVMTAISDPIWMRWGGCWLPVLVDGISVITSYSIHYTKLYEYIKDSRKS